jgi:Flp pilus assembly protein TadD
MTLVAGLGLALCLGALAIGRVGQPSRADARVDPAAHARTARLAEIDDRFKQGVAMLHAGRHEHALVAFHRVLELSPRLPEAHVNLGYALLGLHRDAAARDFFQSAIELRPRQINAYYGLGIALDHLGDAAGALGAMRAYVHLAPPDTPQARKALAAIWEWESARANRRTGAVPDSGKSSRPAFPDLGKAGRSGQKPAHAPMAPSLLDAG